jgi:hypothetical protein
LSALKKLPGLSSYARRDLFEQLQQPRQRFNIARADRVDLLREHYRHRSARLLQRLNCRAGACQDDVRIECDQFLCI